ncbi:MAG: hypothetical protein QOI21_2720 [Actinomycetota bacterium]|jgi:hypothetical protein|nr:hypothetical protein [Actinomycetota bacterium]
MPRIPSHDQGPAGPALARVLGKIGDDKLLPVLTEGLTGADLAPLLAEVLRSRAGRVTAAETLRGYHDHGFDTSQETPFRTLRRAEDLMLDTLPPDFEVLSLAPTVPLGAHALAGIDQSRVVSTIRGSEVSADTTIGLALAAAGRRNALRTKDVRLAAVQRVTRVAHPGGRAITAHFPMLGMVSAGRQSAGRTFERDHVVQHLRFVTDTLRAAGSGVITVRLDPLTSWAGPLIDHVSSVLRADPAIRVTSDGTRPEGTQPYYAGFSYKVFTEFGGEPMEVADGGLVDWARKLLSDRKELMLVTGFGVQRLAMVRQHAIVH